MDTKLRSNDKEGVKVIEKTTEDKGYLVTRLKRLFIKAGRNFVLIYLACFFVMAVTIMCGYIALNHNLVTNGDFTDAINTDRAQNLTYDLRRYALELKRYYVDYIAEDEKAILAITDEERVQYKQTLLYDQFQEEQELNITYQDQINSSAYRKQQYNSLDMNSIEYMMNDGYQIEEKLYAEWDARRDELRSRYQLSKKEIDNKIYEQKSAYYENIKQTIHNNADYAYFITDEETGDVYTNLVFKNSGKNQQESLRKYLDTQPSPYYYKVSLDDDVLAYGDDGNYLTNTTFSDKGLTGYIFIPDYISEGSWSFRLYRNIKDFQGTALFSRIGFPVGVIILSIILAYGFLVRRKDMLTANSVLYRLFMKLPFLLKHIGMLMAFLILSESNHSNYYESFSETFSNPIIVIYAASLLYVTLYLQYLFKAVTNPKKLKDEWEVRSFSRLVQSFKTLWSLGTLPSIGFLELVIGIPSTILLIVMLSLMEWNEPLGALALMLFLCVVSFPVLSIVFLIYNHARLCSYLKNMVSGDMSEIPQAKGLYSKGIEDLKNVNLGVKKSLDETIRSERLKSELITNVSHDLKTPLTAIINYVELLKKTPGQNSESLQYIEVLDKKSSRMKILIEDLFEISKLSSGSLELVYETVNVVDLMKQAIGELSEKIDTSEVEVKTTYSSDFIYVEAEGKKIWRVFENMLDNILKYAAKGSRAYISIQEEESDVCITFKNVSMYELDFEPSELFERFKRGDQSRTTEGSGLGISIAKSIVELHGGMMRITIDGDLFKVEVMLAKREL